jgi:hypothetical protein
VPSVAAARSGLTFLGLDVHRDTISVAVLSPRRDAAEVDRIANDEPSIRRLVAQFPNRRRLRACYEAGPTGYELARLLDRLEVRCQVIAPTLIPKAPGDKARDRPSRLPTAGSAVPRRRTGPDPGADRGRGGRAGPVPGQGGHGGRPVSGPAPPGWVLVAPRLHLA